MAGLDDALRSADAVADRFLEGRKVPGVAYGVVARGELIHSRGVGTLRVGADAPPDADSVFRIASMTKSFTAATILTLRDEGRLFLDDPIALHVPELVGLRGPTADSPPITVRHLMTMASGLATDDPWGDRQQGLDLEPFAELMRGEFTFAWAPGTRFEYSNLGYGILGRLVTNVARAEYRDIVRDRLLRPLGMTSTGFSADEVPPERLAHGYLWRDGAYVEEPIDPYGALASMGGIFSSVRDLARWVGFLADAFPPRDDAEGSLPLSRASRREMQVIHNAWPPELVVAGSGAGLGVARGPEASLVGGGYGLGLMALDHSRFGRIITHSGGYPGFGSNMRWHPASGLGVIVLANHRYGPSTLLATELLASLLASGIEPARRIRPAAATDAARRDIEQLLTAWDDDLAVRLFAMNVELDDPLDRRHAAVTALSEVHGALRPDEAEAPVSESPLHLAWWLAGERGRVRIEIRLSPESPPRVQTFVVKSVVEPSPALLAIADAVVAALNVAFPDLPAGIELGPNLDPVALARTLNIVRASYAPVTLGQPQSGHGAGTATWRLTGHAGELTLTVECESGTGLVSLLSLTPRPDYPPHAD